MPFECEKKDLIHAVGLTFCGMIQVDEKDDFCRIQIQLDVAKPLKRGVFVFTEYQNKVWLPFKFESCPNFYFACGRMGYGVRECDHIPSKDRMKEEDDQLYFNALRAETTMLGKECFKFGVFSRK